MRGEAASEGGAFRLDASGTEKKERMSTPESGATPDRVFKKKKELEIDRLFQALVKLSGSDLHLKVDRPPYVRVKGSLRTLNRGPIDDEEMNRLIFPMMDERNRKIYNDTGGADFAHT